MTSNKQCKLRCILVGRQIGWGYWRRRHGVEDSCWGRGQVLYMCALYVCRLCVPFMCALYMCTLYVCLACLICVPDIYACSEDLACAPPRPQTCAACSCLPWLPYISPSVCLSRNLGSMRVPEQCRSLPPPSLLPTQEAQTTMSTAWMTGRGQWRSGGREGGHRKAGWRAREWMPFKLDSGQAPSPLG